MTGSKGQDGARERVRNAWANRCLRCLFDPFHGDGMTAWPLQVVRWQSWIGVGLTYDGGSLGQVYAWRLRLGWLELRRWADEGGEQ